MDHQPDPGASMRGSATGTDGAVSTIAFPQGLPGFPAATRFALLPLGAGAEGMLVMQSQEDPELRFLVLPYREEELALRRADLEAACAHLGVPPAHAAFLLVVTRRPPACAADGPGQLFVNLRAPLVVDTERRTAVQHVLASTDYSVRHRLAAAA